MWNGSQYLIELQDDSVVDIATDQNYSAGCETCDYGSLYVQDITFKFKSGEKLYISLKKEYEYPISQEKLIIALARNTSQFKKMTLEDFKQFFQELEEYLSEKLGDWYIDSRNFDKEVVDFYSIIGSNF